MSKQVNICVIGSGYVGLVAAACFAEIGHNVISVDNDESKVQILKTGGMPIFEDLLPELLAKHRNQRIQFTSDLSQAIELSDAIFIAVGTPQGSSGSSDLSYVDAVVSAISQSINGYKVLVEKSTVPVYTNEWINRCMLRHGVEADTFDVVSNPEFMREGTAVHDFLHPDRIVVGANNERSADLLRDIYEPLTSGSYYARADSIAGPLNASLPARLLVTSAQSAELIKHASNAFLAMRISFINMVSNLAENVNANIEEIAMGMGLDSRIGLKFLRAGLGYGGSCFPKDVAAFNWVGQQHGVNFHLLEEVRNVNDRQQKTFLDKIRSALWTLRGKKLAVLGLAFKGGTDDVRDSPAIAVIRQLLAEGARIHAFDPAAIEKARKVLAEYPDMTYAVDSFEAAKDAHAVIILTDWAEFGDLDLERLKKVMKFPMVVDGRNLFSPAVMEQHGFTYVSIGRPPVYAADVARKRPLTN